MSDEVYSGLDFLVGAWRGAGTWRGAPFITEARWTRRPDGGLGGLVVSTAAGRTRSESVHIGVHGGQVTAEVLSGIAPAQTFEVHELAAGRSYRLVFTPPSGSGLHPQRWTLERTDAGYHEVFEIAREGAYQVSVECVYAPAESDA